MPAALEEDSRKKCKQCILAAFAYVLQERDEHRKETAGKNESKQRVFRNPESDRIEKAGFFLDPNCKRQNGKDLGSVFTQNLGSRKLQENFAPTLVRKKLGDLQTHNLS